MKTEFSIADGILKSLSKERKEDFNLMKPELETEQEQNEYLLELLLAQHNGKLALFFDNLESVQDGQSPHAITDPTLQHWLQAARVLTQQGLKLILTSRWRLPDWADAEHYPLGKPVYGDYVAMVRLQGLPLEGKQLQTAYATLGGNFRALEFFAKAAQGMNTNEEQAFVAALAKASAESQTDMALAKVVAQRSAEEIALLHRLLAYQTAVPLVGVEIVGEDSPIPSPSPARGEGSKSETVDSVLQRLLAVSLVEQYTNPHTAQTEYQLAPLVRSWLLANGANEPDQPLLQKAANFLLWELEERQDTSWEHKLATHATLRAANLTEQGQRLVLKWIIEPLSIAGMYHTLLKDWLLNPELKLTEAGNPHIRGDALGQIGNQYRDIGDYDTAFDFFKKSLAIVQEIGNRRMEGTVLNNMATIAIARSDYDTAIDFLKKSRAILQEIGDKSGEGTTFINISSIYSARGDYDTALNLLNKSLAIQQEIGNRQMEGVTLNNISQIYHARGNYDTALDILNQSLTIQQEIGDKSGESATLNNISQIFKAHGDYDAALDFLNKSRAIKQEIGDKSGEGATLNNMATIAIARGDYDTALDFLNKSLAITQEIGDKSGEGTTLNNMATTAHARGDYDTALSFFNKSLAMRQEIGDVAGLCGITINIGLIYWQNDQQKEALASWIVGYQIAKKIGHAKTLQALERLAGNLGLEGGLQGWEMLAQQIEQSADTEMSG